MFKRNKTICISDAFSYEHQKIIERTINYNDSLPKIFTKNPKLDFKTLAGVIQFALRLDKKIIITEDIYNIYVTYSFKQPA